MQKWSSRDRGCEKEVADILSPQCSVLQGHLKMDVTEHHKQPWHSPANFSSVKLPLALQLVMLPVFLWVVWPLNISFPHINVLDLLKIQRKQNLKKTSLCFEFVWNAHVQLRFTIHQNWVIFCFVQSEVCSIDVKPCINDRQQVLPLCDSWKNGLVNALRKWCVWVRPIHHVSAFVNTEMWLLVLGSKVKLLSYIELWYKHKTV